VPEAPLEVDAEWAAARAAKQAAAAAPPKARSGALALAIVMIVMIGVIGLMIMQRQPTAKGAEIPDGIELTITAPRPSPVKIDGVKSGTTPLSIRLRGGTRTLTIEGNGVIKEILADRDQTVNLVKP
jgi:hypothetical protein